MATTAFGKNIDSHVWGSNDDEILHTLWKADSGDIDGRLQARLDSFDASGFTLDYTNVNPDISKGTQFLTMYAAVGGSAVPDIGYNLSPLSTGEQTITLDAEVDSLSVIASNTLSGIDQEGWSGNNNANNHWGWMFGGGNSSFQRSMGFSSHSASVNAHGSSSSSSQLYNLLYTDVNGNLLGSDSAALTELTDTNFTLDWTEITTSSTTNVRIDQSLFFYYGWRLTSPPTTPTTIFCDGSSDCDIIIDTQVEIEASGSTVVTNNSLIYDIDASFENQSTVPDLEPGEQQFIAQEADIIGETGTISTANFNWQLVEFTQKYDSAPVVLATPVTQNAAAGEDDSYIIPTISSVNTTHFNVTICQDNGAATCDPSVVSETLHWFAFSPDANSYSWIDVGTTTVTTDGTDTILNFGKTFSNTPVVWTQAQTYNQNGNIASVTWVEDQATKTTSSTPLIGCVHQGVGDACDTICSNRY